MESPRKRAHSVSETLDPAVHEAWAIKRSLKEQRSKEKNFVVLAAQEQTLMASRLQDKFPARFKYFPIDWGKFPDGTDDIAISGFSPTNQIAGEHVLFFASFHNNDVTLSQFSVLIVLLQSFISSLTIVLPFYPVGTNERVETEGKIATANTYALLLSNLPNIGQPSRIMIYDIHALQVRFYFHGSTIPSLHTALPLLFPKLQSAGINAIAFPDDGAAKRFGKTFSKRGYEIIVCGKVRDGLKRKIHIQDGDAKDKVIVIVDDLVQTGGTLFECGVALRAAGASSLNAFVAHAVFPNHSWRNFLHGAERGIFDKFWLTNSQPSITNQLPENDVFEVLDLLPQIIHDLDTF